MSYDDNYDDNNENKNEEPELKGWQKIFGRGKLTNFLSWILIWIAIGSFATSSLGYSGVENTDKQLIGGIIGAVIYLVYRYLKAHSKNK